jgi:cytochrome c oxidase assembly protein subunit 15
MHSAESTPWRHRFAVLLVLATLLLIFVGGLVTSTGSGLSVPDWPLSYGMLMPPMVGGIRYEHGHRMAATAVGFLTLVLAFWTQRVEERRNVRRLAWAALALVVVQGVLGGLTVKFLLPTPVSVTHAFVAQTFFCVTIALAYMLSREWQTAAARADTAGVRAASLLIAGVVFAQLLLGAVMRHTGAGLAIPDFPLAFGRLLPDFDAPGVAVHFAHRLGALAVLAAVIRLALRARRSGEPWLLRPAIGALGLGLLQIALGGATVLSQKAVLPTTAHVAVGAAVLGSCWFVALRALRRLHPCEVPAAKLASAHA